MCLIWTNEGGYFLANPEVALEADKAKSKKAENHLILEKN